MKKFMNERTGYEKDKKELDVILKGPGFKQLIDTSSYKQTHGNLNGTKCNLTIPKSETPKRKKINESNGKTEDTTTEDTITKEEEMKKQALISDELKKVNGVDKLFTLHEDICENFTLVTPSKLNIGPSHAKKLADSQKKMLEEALTISYQWHCINCLDLAQGSHQLPAASDVLEMTAFIVGTRDIHAVGTNWEFWDVMLLMDKYVDGTLERLERILSRT
ncbi:unnamed protein product [Mytilus edulis]|uniref:Uncharacterized protein n=1 Tax=Mytilus edulis TaxID=6550 RepID=A0A8S3RP93_MYTED|nr:unnamed protein product [Mytilus edulis]